MKIRLGLLLTSILLVAATAAAASPAAASPPAPPAPQADGAVTPDCGLSPAAPLTSLTLASSSPAPTFLSGATCGTCSRSPCVGAAYNSVCGYDNGQYGYCLSPLGNNCTGGITFKCQCWYGPLP
jgi:hypothetical protein